MASPYFSSPIVITKPAAPGNDSYYDVLFNAVSPLGPTGTVLNAWCIQPQVYLDYNNGLSYAGFGYAAFEVSAENNFTSDGAINWLLNYYRSGTSSFTATDVQNAIWYLITHDPSYGSTLADLALTHNDFVPDAGEVLAVVIDPVRWEQFHDQNLIVETRAAKLGDRVWSDSNANGIQEAGEAGIAGAKVELVRDANGDGAISANEVLASTTTDANGNYSFKGLTPGVGYQVRFTDPAGYDAASPRQVDGNAASGTNSDGKLSNITYLAPGEYNATVDSGFYKYAKIGDRVWNDTNGNGVQDAGETGKSGVRVELYTCGVNDQPGALVATQTTDANGNYSFSGLKPGDYMVKFIATDGTVLSTANVGNDALDSDAGSNGFTGCYTLTSGETNNTVDAGFKPNNTASLGDRVWNDTNANGIQDAGETGKAGVIVNLFVCMDGVPSGLVGSTVTDANGNYHFNNLPAGMYIVQFTSTDGSVLSTANAGVNDATDSDAGAGGLTGCYTLAVGETNNTVDAGFYKTATIGDRVWEDTNGNGVQDAGETGKSGVRVELYTCGVNDQPGTLVATQTTDANGNYSFTGLKPGDYMVKFIAADGSVLSTANVGNDALDSDAGSNGFTGCYTLGSGETNNTVDAGFYKPATIGDKVWNDTNGNGVQDAGETGKAGVTVQLYTCGVNDQPGTLIGTQTTDANGNYSFTGLKPGDYMVKFIANDGSVLSTANVGNDAFDSDAGANGFTGCYTLKSGETNTTVDAGFFKPGSIGDTVWLDTNRNGYQDETGTGVAGVTVQLKGAGADGVFGTADDTTLATTTTDANGKYLFTNLAPGDYQVQFGNLPAGTAFTTANYGNNGYDTMDSDANQSTGRTDTITLTPGQNRTDVDAGLVDKLGSLGDRVWFDANRNGLQDPGEAGIGGVLVQLYKTGADGLVGTADDVYVNQMFTAADGKYLFDSLEAGNYYVKTYGYNWAIDPTTTVFTQGDAGTNDAIDSDVTKVAANIGYTNAVTLGKGEQNLTVDIGFTSKLGSIGDTVWVDTNRNGFQDEGNTGVAGVTVQLKGTGADGVFGTADDITLKTTTTDANGKYLFTDLTAGNYQVQFSGLLPGTEFTTANYGNNGYDTSDSDANQVTGRTDTITLTAGQDRTDVDAGIRDKLSSLGDRVWFDTNRNGIQDAGEAGIGNVLVRLFNVGADGVAGTGDDVQLADKYTDANGNYLFTDLNAGSYAVRTYNGHGLNAATQEATIANAGTNDAVDSDLTKLDADRVGGFTDVVKLGKGEQNLTVDIGITARLGSIGDTVWVDTNRNGYQDETGTGVSGITVQLKGAGVDGVFGTADDTTLKTTTTDANGKYLFTGLTAGDYQVQFSGLQPGTEFTTANYGNNGYDTADSDANQTTGRTDTVTLTAGQDRTDVDAGIRDKLSSLGDRVWFDTNRNGIQDAGEAGIKDVLVQLYRTGADGLVGTGDDVYVNQMFTLADGKYLFDDLSAGNYYVKTYGYNWTIDPTTTVFTQGDAGTNDAIDSDVTKVAANIGYTNAVTLGKGEQNLTVDIGFTSKLGSIGDTVWVDTNRDGYQNDGNTGVAGVTVQLKGTGADGVFGTADDITLKTTTTDANGKYLFTDLTAGNYQVQFSGLLPGTEFTTANYGNNGYDTSDSDANQVTGRTDTITLTAGQDRTDVDAGIRDKLSSLGDRVWFDTNRNGIQDAGEAGIGNVLVRLYNVGADGVAGTGDDVHVADKNTDANGNYLFTELNAGSYAVRTYNGHGLNAATQEATVANAGGNDATDSDLTKLDADRVGGYTDVVKLGKGEQNLTVDIGITARLGSIGDTVWMDTNRNGYQDDGNTGVAGVTVQLKGAGADGVFGTADDTTLQTTTTDANGKYLFTGLVAGNYQVQFSNVPAGYQLTTANYGNNGYDTADSDANQQTGRTDTIALAVGQDRTDVDAGISTGTASIGDFVWADACGCGVQDAGEKGLAGVSVSLLGAGADKVFGTADDIKATTTTDASGKYSFNNLLGGQYQLTFGAPAGYEAVKANNSNATSATDSDIDANGKTGIINLATGEANKTIDAGFAKFSATVGNRVWNDTNGNGLQDAGESSVAGVKITLIGAGKDGVFGTADDSSRSTTTNANGWYGFGAVAAGQYKIHADAPTGMAFTTQTAGGRSGIDSNVDAAGNSAAFTIKHGQSETGIDVGLIKAGLASVGDRVWLDTNKNGIQDAGEAGVAGVTVTLRGTGSGGLLGDGNDTFSTTVTDANGNFRFTNLQSDSLYDLGTAALPAYMTGYTAAMRGTNGGLDSDVGADGRTGWFRLNAGEQNSIVDIGLVSSYGEFNTFKLAEDVQSFIGWDSFSSTVGDGKGVITISSLPASGWLWYYTPTSEWKMVTAGQSISQAEIQAGKLLYIPGVNQSGGPEYSTAGEGNMKAHYSSFDYVETSGGATVKGHMTIDVAPVADGVATVTSVTMGGYTAPDWQTVNAQGNAVAVGTAGGYVGVWHQVTIAGTNSSPDTDGSESLFYKVTINQVDYAVAPTFLKLADGTIAQADANGDYWLSAAQAAKFYEFRQWGSGPNGSVMSHQDVTAQAFVVETDSEGNIVSKAGGNCMTSANNTPLVLDLNGDGVHTVGSDHGVSFDFVGNGTHTQSGWVDRHDGLLALDLNGDGKINSGKELFGDAMALVKGGTAFNGYEALAQYDDNHDGKIDAKDGIFSSLRVWVDGNGNGNTDAGELLTLGQAGVAAMSLNAVEGSEQQFGNTLGLTSSYTAADGSTHAMADVWFAGTRETPALSALVSDDSVLDAAGMGASAGATQASVAEAMDVSQAAELIRKLVASMQQGAEAHAAAA
ncbi:SdrD B-like domain-containing protein [Variovorax rhizosphaerae]|uniref:SdrD B-like domain-containing protein n=1 Tax=Variovorax rhizosphaerae TaxID=1836200 RepID=A0ABU8WXV2_9BURK